MAKKRHSMPLLYENQDARISILAKDLVLEDRTFSQTAQSIRHKPIADGESHTFQPTDSMPCGVPSSRSRRS